MWNFKEGFTPEENISNAARLQAELEGLVHTIPQVKELKVHINEISTSNMDVMLDSLFESEEDLAIYQDHPEHNKVVAFARSVLANRACFDYKTLT